MVNLECVLDDFFHLFNIPIKYIDSNLNEKYSRGVFNNYHKYIKQFNILDKCNRNTCAYIEVNTKDVNFLIFSCSHYSNFLGHYIIGPFTNNKDIANMPYKPANSVQYIIHTFKSLLRNTLGGKLNYNSYVCEAIDFIHKNYHKDICLNDVCKILNLNKSYFCSLFKEETGVTFCCFLNKVRIEMSKILLGNKDCSIMDVALSVGYNNHNYYTTLFKKLNRITPLEFRNNKLLKQQITKNI